MKDEAVLDIGEITEPLLIFGGPYSNLAATRALCAEAERLGIPPKRVICTGDLVAYCAQPQATVELIRDWGIQVVKGNCEESLANGAADCGCGFAAGTVCSSLSVEWYNYAAQRITDDSRRWFTTLPAALRLNFHDHRLQVVHATPTLNNRFVFASTDREEKIRELEQADCDGLIAGHCGVPFGEKIAGKVWLNAGVIGMPANDGTPDGWYLT
jgi:predicted phosphodiesterase